MATYNELQQRINELKSRTGKGSISPRETFELMDELLEKTKSVDMTAQPLVVVKSYNTLALANADKNPINTATNKPLALGQLISVIADGTNNAVYRLASLAADGTPTWEKQAELGDMAAYAKTGGSEKTLKNVEDDLVQLAGEIDLGGSYDKITSKQAIPVAFKKGNIAITYKAEYGTVTERLHKDSFSVSLGLWEELANSKNDYLIDQFGAIDANGQEIENFRNSKRTKYIRIRETNTIYNYSSLSASKMDNGEYAVVFVYNSDFNYLGAIGESLSETFRLKKTFTRAEIIEKFPKASYFRCNTPFDSSFAIVSDQIYATMPQKQQPVFNADVEKPRAQGLFYDFDTAVEAVPEHLRKKGVEVIYMSEYGSVTVKLISEEWSKLRGRWRVVDTPLRDVLTYENGNCIVPGGEEVYNFWNNGISNYIQIRNGDNSIYNYIVLNSALVDDGEYVAIFIYDDAFNLIGTINESVAGFKAKKTFTKSEVIAKFPKAFYFRCNTEAGRSFGYVAVGVIVRNISIEQETIHGFKFNVVGYTKKSTGTHIDQSSYRTTGYLRYLGRDIIISGFSGQTNEAALILMYDNQLNYIGYINEDGSTVSRNVYNYRVPASRIDSKCAYIKANAAEAMTNRYIYGVEYIGDISMSLLAINESMNSRLLAVENQTLPTTIFNIANVRRKIEFNNYLGNAQNIHPKVLFFKEKKWNYHFWMAYTPYPRGETDAENPCIAVSNDGLNWTVPIGLKNPVTPTPSDGYNSDTHLLYREDLNQMELWYRPVKVVDGRPISRISRKISKNGIDWGEEQLVRQEGVLSPAIIYENGKYIMWGVSGGVKRYESSDLQNWTESDEIIDFGSVSPWHLDIVKTEIGYEFVIQAYEAGGGNNSSDLFYCLKNNDGFSKPVKIIQRGDLKTDFDHRGIYRASIVKIGIYYYIYYSCLDEDWNRWMGLKCGADILNLTTI